MTVQTSYSLNVRPALIGMQADASLEDITTRVAETIIPYGRVAVRGVGDRSVKLVSGVNDLFLGIALRIQGEENPYNLAVQPSEKSQYEITEFASILRTGSVWVYSETATTPGQPVYYRYAANGPNTILGRFRSTDDAGFVTLLTGAQFETVALAGSMARIRLVKG